MGEPLVCAIGLAKGRALRNSAEAGTKLPMRERIGL
jgi:hypothetical protein